jgi:hypothetical protein
MVKTMVARDDGKVLVDGSVAGTSLARSGGL